MAAPLLRLDVGDGDLLSVLELEPLHLRHRALALQERLFQAVCLDVRLQPLQAGAGALPHPIEQLVHRDHGRDPRLEVLLGEDDALVVQLPDLLDLGVLLVELPLRRAPPSDQPDRPTSTANATAQETHTLIEALLYSHGRENVPLHNRANRLSIIAMPHAGRACRHAHGGQPQA
jgi:hypothetical protein